MKNLHVRKSTWIALAVFAILIVLLDQLTKALTVRFIPANGDVPVIENMLHLTYVRNEGAAFSMLRGMRWLFVVLVGVYFAALAFMLHKKIIEKPFELWCFAAISGGAVGNMIDRITTGKVVDMIVLKFLYIPMPSFTDGRLRFSMTPFAVFNLADCFITCGVIALAVYILFFSKKSKPAKTEDISDEANM